MQSEPPYPGVANMPAYPWYVLENLRGGRAMLSAVAGQELSLEADSRTEIGRTMLDGGFQEGLCAFEEFGQAVGFPSGIRSGRTLGITRTIHRTAEWR